MGLLKNIECSTTREVSTGCDAGHTPLKDALSSAYYGHADIFSRKIEIANMLCALGAEMDENDSFLLALFNGDVRKIESMLLLNPGLSNAGYGYR